MAQIVITQAKSQAMRVLLLFCRRGFELLRYRIGEFVGDIRGGRFFLSELFQLGMDVLEQCALCPNGFRRVGIVEEQGAPALERPPDRPGQGSRGPM